MLEAFEGSLLCLAAMKTTPGQRLEEFLADTHDGNFHGHRLANFGQDNQNNFERGKVQILEILEGRLMRHFHSIESEDLLQAAAKLTDPREWPEDREELALFGGPKLNTVSTHFEVILQNNGCDLDEMWHEWPALKAWMKRHSMATQANPWPNLFVHHADMYPNLLMVMEAILVLPMSTAAVERGFSVMKRVKTDWRSGLKPAMLSILMGIAINGPETKSYNAMRAIARWWEGGKRAQRPGQD